MEGVDASCASTGIAVLHVMKECSMKTLRARMLALRAQAMRFMCVALR
jgi:hypothetical protein